MLNDLGYFCVSMVYFVVICRKKVYSMMQIHFGVSRFCRQILIIKKNLVECFNELIAQYNALTCRHQLE